MTGSARLMLVLAFFAAISFSAIACAQTPATAPASASATALKMGTGFAQDADPAAAFRAALAQAKSQLDGEPAFVMFCQNHLRPNQAAPLVQAAAQELGQTPYLGVGLMNEAYEPVTQAGHGGNGVAVLAFGQGFTAKVFLADGPPVQEGWLYQTGKEARDQQRAYAEACEIIGKKLGEQVKKEGQPNNLVLIEGTLHQPANYYFTQGFASPLYLVRIVSSTSPRPGPEEFSRVMGGASADAGYFIHDGKIQPRKVAAIALGGEFDVVQVGLEKLEGSLQVSYDRLLTEASRAVGSAKPIGAIMYGCASWQSKSDESVKAAAAKLAGVPLYGHCSGGEIGRRWIGDWMVASTNLGMMSLIVPKGSPAPGRKPPTAEPRMAKLTCETATAPVADSKDGYLTDWLVLGPWQYNLKDATRADGQDILDMPFAQNEGTLVPSPGRGAEARVWTPYVTDVPEARGPVVNLDMFYGYPNFAACYMGTKVVCDQPTQARLYCGSDDYIAVWVNGQQVVHYNDAPRGAQWDQQKADIELKAGENIILVKVIDVVSGWAAIVRLTDRQDRPLVVQSIPWK